MGKQSQTTRFAEEAALARHVARRRGRDVVPPSRALIDRRRAERLARYVRRCPPSVSPRSSPPRARGRVPRRARRRAPRRARALRAARGSLSLARRGRLAVVRPARRGALVVRGDAIDDAAELATAGPADTSDLVGSAVVPKLPRSELRARR